MPRYFIHPRSTRAFWVDDDVPSDDLARTIPSVSDHDAIDTGLVDGGGNAIMRGPAPIGFGREEEQ